MRPRARPRFFAHAIVLACVLSSHAALADGPSADKLFEEASALIEEQRYADAIPKLEEAQRLDPGVGTQFNLAVCYAMTGRLALAYRNFSQVENLARAAGKKERELAAHAELEQLRPRVSFASIRVEEPGPVVVRADGEVVGAAELDFVPLDPGEHHIEAIAASKKPFEATVIVKGEAERHDVSVPALDTIAEPKPISDPIAPPTPVGPAPSSARRTAGYVAGAVGFAGAGVAIVSGIVILSDKNIAGNHCSPHCDDAGRGAASQGASLFPINWTGWAVAGVGLGAAAYVLLTPSSSRSPQTPAARTVIMPAFDGRTASAFVSRQF
jgi:hypothetical protein